MSSTPKKPPAPGTTRTPTPNSNTPSRSPSRIAAQGTAATKTATSNSSVSSTSGVSRARSIRSGAPMSARAAARKPAENDSVVDDVRAEMQAKLDELQQQLHELEKSHEDSQKQTSVLQLKLDESLKEQGDLEESVHEQTEKLEELENAKKESERAKRELEQIYESERAASMKEKDAAQAKHDELEGMMLRMKESLAQRELKAGLDDERRPSPTRTSSLRSATSPNPSGKEGDFAPPSSLQRSDSRSGSKLVMQKDKIIEGLRIELAEAQIRIVELENLGGGQLQEVQRQLYETKIQNGRLMEENESFQLLLSEKTLNGDLAQSDLLRPSSMNGSSSRDAAAAGTSLADELASHDEEDSEHDDRRQHSEIVALKDQNKALTLYINNIISRLLQHEQFEQILDKSPDLMAGPNAASRRYGEAEKELPPPPPPKDGEVGLLQKAKNVMSAMPMRPLSFVQPSDSQQQLQQPSSQQQYLAPTVNEDPNTAPSIPIGKSSSSRGSSTHRRANSDWPAASMVSNMYRGPSPQIQGPGSPGLGSPPGQRSFFATPQPLGQRVNSSQSSVPTVADVNKENISQRDSKVSNRDSFVSQRSHRASITSNPGVNLGDFGYGNEGVSSNPSSPPRSTTSSGDKDARAGGAIMMGSKMRPLRLVEEAKDDEAAKKQANRGSWFGWMNKGVPGPTSGGAPGRNFSNEGGA